MVDSETRFTESSVSFSNFVANIVVVAAVGALAAIAIDISMFPFIPIKSIAVMQITGITTSLSPEASHALPSFNPVVI